MSQNYTYKTSENETIHITTYGNENFESKNCLIYVHGFKGFKDWGFVPYLGQYFADSGFFVITFNFSHNGVGKLPIEFTELDKFAKNTYSREVNELSEIIDSYRNGFFGNVENSKIGLLGHSRGGGIAFLAAKEKSEVNAVATWASIAELDRYTERQKADWREKGVFEVVNTRTNQIMCMNLSFLEDIERNMNAALNIEKAVKELNRPLFIAHGEQDLAVSIEEAKKLYEWSNKENTEYFMIHATGHTFDIVHPFAGTNDKFEKLLSKTNNFFKTILD